MLPLKQRESVTADVAQIWQGVGNLNKYAPPQLMTRLPLKEL